MNVRHHKTSSDSMITSLANPRIKAIRSLKSRRAREEPGLFFIEGYHIVHEAVESSTVIEQLVVAPNLLTSWGHKLAAQLRRSGVMCLEVSDTVFESISSRDGPQGIAAVVRQHWTPLELCAGTGRWVALESVQYPGNLGTILRTCDATGCAGVILIGDATDPFDPLAVRASTGAVLTQTLVRASFADFAGWVKQHQMLVVGTSPAATTSYQEVDYQHPLVLCMGSERDGLSAEQQAFCHQMVRIPMAGRRDSLNLAVATAVVLYEIFTSSADDLHARRNPTERHAAQPPPAHE